MSDRRVGEPGIGSMEDRLSAWRIGAVRAGFAVAAAALAVWLLFVRTDDGRLRRAMEAWDRSGDPIRPTDVAAPEPSAAQSFDRWIGRASDGTRAFQRRQRVLVGGGTEDFSAAELEALVRLDRAVPSDVTAGAVNAGARRYRELRPLALELADTTVAGRLPAPGTAVDDFLSVDAALGRPLVEFLLAGERPPAPDRRSSAIAYVAGREPRPPVTIDSWQFGVLAEALANRLAALVREPARDAAARAELRRASEVAIDLWELTLGGWSIGDALNHEAAVSRLVGALALAVPRLDRDDRERVRARVEGLDVLAHAERNLVRARTLDHAAWERARKAGALPVEPFACFVVEGSAVERWLGRQLDRVEELLDPELCTGEHARFLEAAAAAVDALRRSGLDRHLPDTVEDRLVGSGRDHYTDGLIHSWRRAYDSMVLDETRRRLLLCGLAWSIDGEAGLSAALTRYPDPFSGAAFTRITASGAPDTLRSDAAAHLARAEAAWPLVGS